LYVSLHDSLSLDLSFSLLSVTSKRGLHATKLEIIDRDT
jgi:hypothetical protein